MRAGVPNLCRQAWELQVALGPDLASGVVPSPVGYHLCLAPAFTIHLVKVDKGTE